MLRDDFIRPSNLGPLELCPGKAVMSERAVAAVPAILRLSRPAAEQGTAGHLVAAQTLGLIYGVRPWCSPDDALAKMAALLAQLEGWAADATRRCVAYVVSVVNAQESAGFRVSVLIEVKLSGKGVAIARGGTADVVIVCRNESGDVVKVIVIDHKLGWLDQGHAADHPQLGTYAVMASDRWQTTCVEVHLSQGRRMDFTAALYGAAELMDMRARAIRIINSAKSDYPLVRASIEACRYCPALTHCRAVRERIMHAREELALFGDSVSDRVQLMEAAALARRFAEEVKALQKEWTAENQSNQARDREAVTP